ncbi:catechol 2,3-dioxygenase-like lactoylglutathione lyase family enzyme [Catenulispora sp. EB89]|uniref:VOC family protein n=1 Tax=Catenulispora sp. EB89 TaxID=3156257 RepID=UPI0035193CE7
MVSTQRYPRWCQVVLDTPDVRGLAEFYRELLGFTYRPGDEPPAPGEPDPRGQDWLVLNDPRGAAAIAFQQVDELPATTWPEEGVAQQYHLDLDVPALEDLEAQHERVLALGATLRYDRSDDQEEPLRVYADPSGHLFCIFVSGDAAESAETGTTA